MRFALSLILALLLFTNTAHACQCVPDTDGRVAAAVMDDPSISVVDVYVRAINARTNMSVLDIKNRHSGGLAAPYVRAKSGGTSCDIHPRAKTSMTVLIKNESDGTYSLVGGCKHAAVMQHLKKGQ